MESNAQLQIIGEVALASLLGGLIGLEREMADKPAGLRTHMLIAGASALLTGIGSALLSQFDPGSQNAAFRVDPLRIIEAIITGISFLGAGTIIRGKHGHQIEGLTTAASILFSAALGISVALRLFWLATGAAAFALFVLRGLGWAEAYLERRRRRGPRQSRA